MSGSVVLLISEDSASSSLEVLRSCFELAVFQIQRNTDLKKVDYVPLSCAARSAAIANRWKSAKNGDYQATVALLNSIERHLKTFPEGLVAFHIDGDEPWPSRLTSENRRKYSEIIIQRLRERHVDRDCLQRLLLFMPFYSMEAWLFGNPLLLSLVSKKEDVEVVRGWHETPKLLDETSMPKDKVSICSSENLQLANKNSGKRLMALKTSFYFAVRNASMRSSVRNVLKLCVFDD